MDVCIARPHTKLCQLLEWIPAWQDDSSHMDPCMAGTCNSHSLARQGSVEEQCKCFQNHYFVCRLIDLCMAGIPFIPYLSPRSLQAGRALHGKDHVSNIATPDRIFALQDHILNFVNSLSGFLHGRTTPPTWIPVWQGHAIRIA